jgi:hypothetical protein
LFRYAAFGTQLNSTIELPELPHAAATARDGWTLVVGDNTSIEKGDLLGTDVVYGSVAVRLFGADASFRLDFDDTGSFDIRPEHRTITWHPGARRDGDAVRADILGRVIAVAMHADGSLALHASAVAIEGQGVAFLGPKHAGKSTIAMSLVRRGARLLTDDTLAVHIDANGHPAASPGVHRVRLWDDSLRALGGTAQPTLGAKPTLDALPADSLQLSDVSLAACYVLAPVATAGDAPVRRDRLSARDAALACVGFSKLGVLLGGRESGVVLDRAARLARSTAFYVATVHRDLDRLDRVADEISGWHGATIAARTEW